MLVNRVRTSNSIDKIVKKITYKVKLAIQMINNSGGT